jgi:hypothetical protein
MADKHKKLVTMAVVATAMIALIFRIQRVRNIVAGV